MPRCGAAIDHCHGQGWGAGCKGVRWRLRVRQRIDGALKDWQGRAAWATGFFEQFRMEFEALSLATTCFACAYGNWQRAGRLLGNRLRVWIAIRHAKGAVGHCSGIATYAQHGVPAFVPAFALQNGLHRQMGRA